MFKVRKMFQNFKKSLEKILTGFAFNGTKMSQKS